MRKQNSEFLTAFTSEAECDLKNTDYFGFMELDSFACYVIADGIDDQTDAAAARVAVSAAISTFAEAPSMGRRRMKACLKAANNVLLETRSKRKLKASILILLTNYSSLRYGQAGNIRFRLFRNGFLRFQSTDQSLTADLVRGDKVEPDKVARHQERNNLYAYLGQEKEFHPFISRKMKLTDADAIALCTRGVWEHIDDGELKDLFEEATKEPQETVGRLEDMLLSKQPQDLGKYTFVAIFVNKIFTDPNRKRRIRRVLMLLIPVLIAAVVLAVTLGIRHNRRQEKIRQMELKFSDTLEYIQTDNYIRAKEQCEEALALAEELKDGEMQKKLGDYQKLIEAVLAGEEALEKEQYPGAQNSYSQAAKRSRYVDNVGLEYIEDKMALTADYLAVYDLINLGDTLALNLQEDKAEEKYLEAKALAGKIYFDRGRQSALEALEKLYTDQKEKREEEDEKRQELLTRQESAANYVAQGDEAFIKGDYESAIVFYSSAVKAYEELEDDILKEAAEEKLAITEEKLKEQESKKEEAKEYEDQAVKAEETGDFVSAKKYYLLAKDIYASLKMNEEVEGIARKIDALGIDEDAADKAAAREEAASRQASEDAKTAEEAKKAAEEAERAARDAREEAEKAKEEAKKAKEEAKKANKGTASGNQP